MVGIEGPAPVGFMSEYLPRHNRNSSAVFLVVSVRYEPLPTLKLP